MADKTIIFHTLSNRNLEIILFYNNFVSRIYYKILDVTLPK